jgi:hypothetical protein
VGRASPPAGGARRTARARLGTFVVRLVPWRDQSCHESRSHPSRRRLPRPPARRPDGTPGQTAGPRPGRFGPRRFGVRAAHQRRPRKCSCALLTRGGSKARTFLRRPGRSGRPRARSVHGECTPRTFPGTTRGARGAPGAPPHETASGGTKRAQRDAHPPRMGTFVATLTNAPQADQTRTRPGAPRPRRPPHPRRRTRHGPGRAPHGPAPNAHIAHSPCFPAVRPWRRNAPAGSAGASVRLASLAPTRKAPSPPNLHPKPRGLTPKA